MKSEINLYKKNITKIVELYKKTFFVEYNEVVKIIKEKRKNQKKETAATNGNIDVLERALIEYPETLFNILQNRLSPPALLWLTNKKGVRWFAKTFKEFSLATKI